MQGLAGAILGATEIAQHWHACGADGDIREAESPGAAEGVADNNSKALARASVERVCETASRTVRILRE